MRKNLRKTLLTLLAVTAMAVIFCFGVGALEYENYKYRVLKNGTVEIIGYTGTATTLVIPDKIDGKNVTSIGDCAFDSYFALKTITIPENITTIGYAAFYSCYNLEQITIPANVKNISEAAFECCTGLTNISVDKNNRYYFSDVCGVLFNNTGTELIQYPASRNGASYTIPEGVITIADRAFYESTKLKSVNIPDTVTTIGFDTFSRCSNLIDITIPDSVKYISNDAFYSTAWYDNQPNGVVYAGNVLYNYKGEMLVNTKIVVKDGTKSISRYAFYDHKNLTDITIPDSVIAIGEDAFYNTYWYNNQADGLVYAGKVAYKLKGENSEVVIKNDTKAIADAAFCNCYNLKNITLPDTIINIGSDAFANCTSLASITIPNNVVRLGSYAFVGCDGLHSIYIPANVTEIGDYALGYIKGLNDYYKVPNHIKNYPFEIVSYKNSAAEKYAKDNGFDFVEYGSHTHSYTSKITKKATCIETGVKTYTCSVCKATKTETIAKISHKYGEYKPVCDFTNFPQDTQTRTCEVCEATEKTTYTMEYYNSNGASKIGSNYVEYYFDEMELDDVGGVKFYIYDTASNKYVRVEKEKVEMFGTEDGSEIYRIKGLKPDTEYTFLVVLYGCWDWSGGPGEKEEDDIREIAKSKVKTKAVDPNKTTSSIKTAVTHNTVKLTWVEVDDADGYRVYQKVNGSWKALAYTTNLTYTIKSLKVNTKYDFAVRAYVLDGKTKVLAPKYKSVSVTTSKATLGTTSKITATKTSSSVTLKWNKVTGATGYRVYQKTASGWKTLANTTKLTYTIKSLKANTSYTFAIRTYVTKSGKTTLAPKYKSLAVTTASSSSKPAQVKNVKATPTATTVKLTWSKISGVKGYEIFSYNSKTKKYTSLGKTTGTTFTVKKLKANTAYSYAVQAYKVSGKKNVYGKVSSIVKVTTKLATPTLKVTSTKTKANLSWADIKGETGYAIYMATSKGGKYTHLANYKANSTKATKSKLKSGKTYYFKIRAYKKASGKTTYSAYSAVKSVKIK